MSFAIQGTWRGPCGPLSLPKNCAIKGSLTRVRFVAWTTDEVTRAASTKTWGGRRDLNPRLSEPQSDALPAELLPPQSSKFTLVCVSGKAASRPNAVAGKGAQQCCAPTESSPEYRCL